MPAIVLVWKIATLRTNMREDTSRSQCEPAGLWRLYVDGSRFFFHVRCEKYLGVYQEKGMIGTGRCRQVVKLAVSQQSVLEKAKATPDGHQYGQESVPHKREKAAPDAICIHSQKKESSIDGIEISLKLSVAK